ncbi:MAG: SagB family peptide dehydrogenase [Chloroflexi bacterium]|nr:SagB family peptide dehydrogenase [Chloroflexota bacterium]MCL5074055.1 SagB family peptide dehydrogenase [Chloroflexota bacterium]
MAERSSHTWHPSPPLAILLVALLGVACVPLPSATATPAPVRSPTPISYPPLTPSPTPRPSVIPTPTPLGHIPLPQPRMAGPLSLEETIAKRRSMRSYSPWEPSLAEIAQLLWAAQGITDKRTGFRAAPSAGALYPLEVYVVTRQAVYRYLANSHALARVKEGDVREALCTAGLSQEPIREAPLSIVITAVYERTRVKYGERAERYVLLEAGHAAQNILLQAVSLGLGGVPIGAFYDQEVQEAIGCPSHHRPLYIIPIGRPRTGSALISLSPSP